MSSDPVEMVRAISDEYGLEWDDESILTMFSSFIRDRKAGRDFEQYVRAVAMEHNESAERAWILGYGGRVTAEQIRSFVARGELICPYCKYDDPEGGSFETQDNGVRQEMACPSCRRTWTFLYEIVWVIEDGEEEKNG